MARAKDKPFEPVIIETDRVGRLKGVGSTREAAELLLTKWPASEGEAYRAAIRACLSTMEGEAAAEDARAAFVEAAREAGNYVRG